MECFGDNKCTSVRLSTCWREQLEERDRDGVQMLGVLSGYTQIHWWVGKQCILRYKKTCKLHYNQH